MKNHLKQDKFLQIRINTELKNKIDLAAKLHGMPTATYIKFVVSEHLKKQEAIDNLRITISKNEFKESLLQEILHVKPEKKSTFQEALDLINQK